MQTKGPWEFSIFEEYPERRGGYFVYALGIKPCIAKLSTTGEYSDYDPDKSEAHDNARLISAAPDLLGGCKAALSVIENACRLHPELKENELDEISIALRKAISKATGITKIRSIKQASAL